MTTPTDRRPDIDWLRVLATLLVIAFHVAMVFNPAPFFHLRSDELSMAALVFCAFVNLWHMPLFFALAGWSLARAMAVQSPAALLGERVRRLLVPLATGSVLLMPWIKYVELRGGMDLSHTGLRVVDSLQDGYRQVIPAGLPSMPPFDETVGAFLPTFFTDLGRFSWGHLWFLAYLFTFTVVLLPLLHRAARSAWTPRAAWLAWAPVVPLVFVQVVLRPMWSGVYNLYDDWANVAWYATFLLAGFALGRDPGLEAVVHAQGRRAIAVGLATCCVLLAGLLGAFESMPLMLAGSGVAGWCFVVAILAAGRRWLSFSTPALAWLAEAALPAYVLHQAAIVLPGWWIVGLPANAAVRFALLLVVAYATTFGAYALLVRPLQPLRLLFGMRPLACPLPRRRVAAPATLLLLVVLFGAASTSDAAPTPVGRWYAEGGAAKVEIRECGPALCGRVVWLRSPWDEDGCELTDENNPDPALRARPLVGLEILRDLRPDGHGQWDGGSIYDPTSGRSWSCAARLGPDGRLLLRGYLAFQVLGRTATWLPAEAGRRTCRRRTA